MAWVWLTWVTTSTMIHFLELLRMVDDGRQTFYRTETLLRSWMPALILTLQVAHQHFAHTLDCNKLRTYMLPWHNNSCSFSDTSYGCNAPFCTFARSFIQTRTCGIEGVRQRRRGHRDHYLPHVLSRPFSDPVNYGSLILNVCCLAALVQPCVDGDSDGCLPLVLPNTLFLTFRRFPGHLW